MNSLFLSPIENPWDSLKSAILDQFGQENGFQQFFGSMEFFSFENHTLCIELRNEVAAEMAQKYYAAKILSTAIQYYPNLLKVQFCASSHEEILSETPVWTPPIIAKIKVQIPKSTLNLNPEQHFENYAVGESNREAFSSMKRVAEAPGLSLFNPLFLHGGPGLGKTHLLNSLAHFAETHQTAQNIIIKNADELKREFFTSVNTHKSASNFQNNLRKADLLLIDDVQFLIGYNQFQQELISLFDYLVSKGKQVVIISDRPPADIPNLIRPLVQKCHSGLLIDIKTPDTNLRADILRQLSIRFGLKSHVTQEMFDYLSHKSTGDARELSGMLTRLMAFCDLNKEKPSLDRLKQLFGDLNPSTLGEEATQKLTLAQITDFVASYYQIDPAKIVSRSRMHEAALPRKVCMYLARTLTDLTLPTIGTHYNRDYSTVIFSLKAMTKLLSDHEEFAREISQIKTQLLQWITNSNS